MSEISNIEDSLEKTSLHQLMGGINEFRKSGHQLSFEVKVTILRNHTLDNLKWFLEGFGICENIEIAYSQGGYDTLMEEISNAESILYRTHPEVIVISLVLENLVPEFTKNTFSVEEVTESIQDMTDSIRSRSSGLIIINTLLGPLYNSDGIFSLNNVHSIENKIKNINAWISQLCQRTKGIYVVDWNQLEQRLGEEQSRDYRLWYAAKSLLTNRFLKEYAFEIIKIIKALKGASKKCLILDCDNTLWGGIIGEDGIGGIQLDPQEYPGNIYYQFQQNILRLVERGVLVVLCSKNNEDDVWEVLDQHPFSLLKRVHLANWRINWEDKVSNIQSLVNELNIGPDSFVFVDDNPAEIEWVKQSFPEVTTWQVPQDLSLYPSLLIKCGLFDTLSITDEDKNRTSMYQAETKRKEEQNKLPNYDDYLTSLKLVATICSVSDQQIPRVAQLTQKTNQFNLTTRRYSEKEIKMLIDHEDYDVMYLHLKDRFGDHGIVGVMIIKHNEKIASFDTFLLSCRVLGRKVEELFLDVGLNTIKDRGKCSVEGEYIATEKNMLVRDFFEERGFSVSLQDNERKVFTYEIGNFEFKVPAVFKQVISEHSRQGVNI
jgi:FkbH-like protein